MAPPKKKATAAAPATAKPKRRNLTPAERIAKLESDLAAARVKAEADGKKAGDRLIAKRDKLAARVKPLMQQISEINNQLRDLGIETGGVEDVPLPGVDD